MGQTPSSPSSSSTPSPPILPSSTTTSEQPSACPVDHKSREAWLRAAQAQNPHQTPPAPHPIPGPPPSAPIAPHPISATADASACPVDHKSREAWLKAAQTQQPQPTSDGTTPQTPAAFRPRITNSRLSTQREVSSIPRAFPNTTDTSNASTAAASPSTAHGLPAPAAAPNSQSASAADIHTSPTGHWVYPSERMFFAAMERKNHAPRASDMSTIIPIHNAVNERTWAEVLRWEAGQGGDRCGGPKLVSFEGDASKLTPRAMWRGWMGYQRPFDRHDWVVDRCGVRVEYVIDFYEGRKEGGKVEGGPSFYLDVRPKLNSWEGCRMRVARFWGWG